MSDRRTYKQPLPPRSRDELIQHLQAALEAARRLDSLVWYLLKMSVKALTDGDASANGRDYEKD
jgi:hypothetical protein